MKPLPLHESERGDKTVLRTLFDEVAHDYDEVRPDYPEALIKNILRISALPKNGKILEIGCGTGQATLPFAKRGYAMTCLDVGEAMVAIAREKLEPYPLVRVERTSFEDWQPEGKFDLVISATAFHWVAPEVGYPKAASVLEPGGHFARFSNLHPKPYTGFHRTVQPIYDAVFGPEADKGASTEESIEATALYIDSTGLFEPVEVKTYAWERRYTTAQYLKLLNTYSNHRALEPASRVRFFEEVARHIEEAYEGVVTRPYLSVLFIAKRA